MSALASGPDGRAAVVDLVDALRARYGPAEREAGLEALRPKLAGAALVPSRAYDDASVWTAAEGNWRALSLEGRGRPGAYRLGIRATPAPPREPGEYRARVTLRRLEPGRFEWTTHDALALGRLRPEELSAAWSSLLRAARRQAGNSTPGTDMPRAARACGRLFDLETLALDAQGDGTVRIEVAVRLRPDRIAGEAPKLAAYVTRRSDGLRMAMTAFVADGRALWSAEATDTVWRLRLRVREGTLAPLEGPPAHAGGNLRVVVEYSFKAGLFRVGFRGLAADVDPSPWPGQLAFVARFTVQPDWQVPFIVEPFMRASLRYPFEGAGTQVSLTVREDEGRSQLVAESRVRVRESWIVRWLGGFSSKALAELRAAEAEADRYALECLTAVREDIAALTEPAG